MSGASERANGRASGSILTSLFLFVPDHSAVVVSVESERSHRFTKEDEDKNGDGMQI